MVIKKIPTKNMSREDWLKERKKGIDEFNRIFNENVTIAYSEAWDYGLYSNTEKEEVEDNDVSDI